jgi:hypothetical protein
MLWLGGDEGSQVPIRRKHPQCVLAAIVTSMIGIR